MAHAAAIFFIVLFTLEAVTILIGNTFTIFVFWSKRSVLRRTSFLLINLALVDLLVGIAEPFVLGTGKIHSMLLYGQAGQPIENNGNPSSAFEILGSSTSVMFLALVSLERAFSVLRPLYHRAMDTRVYIYSIVTVWVVGFIMAGASLLGTYHTEVDRGIALFSMHSFLFVCVLVICVSYLTIRTRLSRTTPMDNQLGIRKKISTEQSLRLSRTFFIVVFASLVLWLPAFVLYTIKDFCRCIPPPVVWFVNFLHLANSMVNPLVYAFRMPIFKEALKNCLRKRQQNIESINSTSLGNAAVTTELSLH